MFHWAHGAMVHACDLLKLSFGSKACRMSDEGQKLTKTPKPETVSLTFEPALGGGDDARCPCPGVERYIHTSTSQLEVIFLRLPFFPGGRCSAL